jgi:hypothetical protein
VIEPVENLSSWEHAKELARRLQLRGIVVAGVILIGEKILEHYVSVPDWGFDIAVLFVLGLAVYLVCTQPDVRDAVVYIDRYRPQMLFPLLVIAGAVLGGSAGAFGAWRIRHYRQGQKPTESSAQSSTTTSPPTAPIASPIASPTSSPHASTASPRKKRPTATELEEQRRIDRDLRLEKQP